jgi:hypothetical protein
MMEAIWKNRSKAIWRSLRRPDVSKEPQLSVSIHSLIRYQSPSVDLMADEAFIGQPFETFQFLLQPIRHFFVDPRLGRKQTDHDHLAGSLPNGSAKKTGMAFVQNIDDAVIVDVFAAFTDFVAAGRT